MDWCASGVIYLLRLGLCLKMECGAEPVSLILFHGIDDDVLRFEGNKDFTAVSEIVNSMSPNQIIWEFF